MGTHSQADSTVSQAVNNSFQVDSTNSQPGMNVGNPDAQIQASSTFSQAVSSPQAGTTSSQVGSTSPQPVGNAGNVGAQSQAGSASFQASKVISPQAGNHLVSQAFSPQR